MIQHNDPRREAMKHTLVIEAMMARMLPKVAEYENRGTWADVGSLRHSRDLLIEAAFAVGAITEDEAKALGVEL